MLKEGDKAPDFTAESFNGKVALRDFKGRNVVLYFYPKDNTPGCTIEANDFTYSINKFEKENTVILGVSKDNMKSHDKFKKDHKLKIDLLSDEDLAIQKAYGVWGGKKFLGRVFTGTIRTTFLIDKNGRIARIWPNVKVNGHAEEVLKAVKTI